MTLDDYQVSPFGSGQLTQVNVTGFTETGSFSPLTFGNQGEAYVSSDLGVKVSRHPTLKWGIQWSPYLSVAWEHVYQGSNDSLSANFGSGNNFTVAGSATGTDGAVLGAGFTAQFDKNLNLYASYQGKAGLTNYTDQDISGGINFGF
jgi:outer membrane autotransporter protein